MPAARTAPCPGTTARRCGASATTPFTCTACSSTCSSPPSKTGSSSAPCVDKSGSFERHNRRQPMATIDDGPSTGVHRTPAFFRQSFDGATGSCILRASRGIGESWDVTQGAMRAMPGARAWGGVEEDTRHLVAGFGLYLQHKTCTRISLPACS